MKTIWLHAGIRKAGSTAIQDFLCKNKNALLKKGYDYPIDFHPKALQSYKLGLSGMPQCGNINHIITNSFAQKKESMQQMIGNLKIADDKDIILSNENFFFITGNEKYWKLFRDTIESKSSNHKIKVILYLRRQDEILESMYRQDIQDINHKNYKFRDDYVDDPDSRSTFDFKKYIDFFVKEFGKENIIIRTFEKDQLKDQNVVSDFIEVIGIKNTEGLNIQQESNITFSHEIVEYLRICKNFTPILHKRLTNYLTVINPKVNSKKISMANPNLKRKIALEYEVMNNEIAKKYLNQEQLFYKPLPEEDPEWEPYDMSVEDSVKVSSLLFISLTQKVFTIQDELNTLRNSFKQYLQGQIKLEEEKSKKKSSEKIE